MIYSKLLSVSRCLRSRSHVCMSTLAPTFSSSGDTNNIVTKLGPNRISTMILTGKPNRAAPDSFNLNVDDFKTGAISAVSMVTSSMMDNEWDTLADLVERQTISSLKHIYSDLSPEEKALTALDPDDVFLSFISNLEDCEDGNNIHLVTFSLPKLGRCKEMVKENKDSLKKTHEAIHEHISNKELDKEELNERVKKMLDDQKAQYASNDPYTIFRENEIIIGNYRLKRETAADAWTISELAQMSSVKAWPTIFRLRWKGRLSIATRGSIDFYTVLRYDYMTDYIAFMLILAISMLPPMNP